MLSIVARTVRTTVIIGSVERNFWSKESERERDSLTVKYYVCGETTAANCNELTKLTWLFKLEIAALSWTLDERIGWWVLAKS